MEDTPRKLRGLDFSFKSLMKLLQLDPRMKAMLKQRDAMLEEDEDTLMLRAASEIESLRARVAELEKDAKRWDYVMRTEPYSGLLWMALPSEVRNRERHLNNAIDTAIERSE